MGTIFTSTQRVGTVTIHPYNGSGKTHELKSLKHLADLILEAELKGGGIQSCILTLEDKSMITLLRGDGVVIADANLH